MRSLIPLVVCCISLGSLQQLWALPAGERPDTSGLDLLNKLIGQKEEVSLSSGSQTNHVASSALGQPPKWLPGFLRRKPASGARAASPGLAWAQPAEASQIKRRLRRSHVQAHSGGGQHYPKNAQLMRVGCELGTCQVQNLSHRLYQLIGQASRKELSPINPRSPHSFG
ncbi:protein ADM2a [Kryptolebias marmoratus]|uniref:ADM2-like n=1 Tax=Kryptolebias marmoratus TaxID=37003 RepID=A0A3Q3BFQ1_KRYMA|nr:protein ADM2a [Kryptolebias marmoratus]